jgi:hypothetical protein
MIKLFLKMRVDIKIKYDDNFTALFKVVHIDKQQIIMLFLEIKIDIKVRYVDSFTALLKVVHMNK